MFELNFKEQSVSSKIFCFGKWLKKKHTFILNIIFKVMQYLIKYFTFDDLYPFTRNGD